MFQVSSHQCERRVVALLSIRNIANVAITVTQIAIGAGRGVNHVVLFTFSCLHLVVLDSIHQTVIVASLPVLFTQRVVAINLCV